MSDPFAPSWPEPDEKARPTPRLESPHVVECWRCGKPILTKASRCPYCAAVLRNETGVGANASEANATETEAKAIASLLAFFGLMLGVSLSYGLFCHIESAAAPHRSLSTGEMLWRTLGLEAIDTALLFTAWRRVGSPRRGSRHSLFFHVSILAIFLPALAFTLLLNCTYHDWLRQWLIAPSPRMVLFQNNAITAGWTIAICFQPAIVEELFFRYLMFGHLRSLMKGHAVVWVTATMFALAHIGAPFSMPVLFFLGLLLGYARLVGDNIYLPMFLHFTHNAIVMAIRTIPF